MEEIIVPSKDFDFSKISLGQPNGLQGGAYFTKLKYNDNPIFIQTPKCKTKQGIVATAKKKYADLMFTNDDDIFIEWLENLENTLQKLIYEKRNLWFETDFEMDDIEHAFTSPVRSYKGGKFYLVRSNIQQSKNFYGRSSCSIYDEDENKVEVEQVTADKNVISVIEIQGIRFSTRAFQIEINLRQVMLMENKPLFSGCVIKRASNLEEKEDEEANLEITETLEANDSITTGVSPNESELVSIEDVKNEDNNIKETVDDDKANVDAVDNASSTPLLISNLEEENLEENKVIDEDKVAEEVKEVKEEEKNNLEDNLENLEKNEDSVKDEPEDVRTSDKDSLNELEEVDLELNNDLESMTLKKPNEVYYEIYKTAREKAKLAKKVAIQAFLEAKNIKATYMLDDLEDSDNEDEDIDDMLNNLE